VNLAEPRVASKAGPKVLRWVANWVVSWAPLTAEKSVGYLAAKRVGPRAEH